MKWHLQKIKVSDLKEYDKNPMQHNEKDLGDLEVSINKFGVADPIRANTDFMIIGGHGTKKVLEKNNIKEVDCYLPERKLTKAEFKELNVRLNKNRSQSWDFDLLANSFELNELIDFGFEEELTGSKEEKLKEQSENLKFYKMVHVLISFPPDKYLEMKELIESIKLIEGVEIEQSAN